MIRAPQAIFLAELRRSGVSFVDVKDQGGIDPNGVQDSTAAILAARDKLGSNKGVLYFDTGIYRAQGLPAENGLHYVGPGVGAFDASSGAKLKLISSPTDHLIKSTTTGDLDGFQVQGLFLEGGDNFAGRSSFDAINLSSAARAEMVIIENNFIRFFNNGVRGTQNDRWLQFHSNYIHSNENGIYIFNNHPTFSGLNDIRSNVYGLTGDTLFDMVIIGQKFPYNTYGIKPQPSGSFSRNVVIGCGFGYCTTEGLVIDAENIVSDCRFLSNDNTDAGVIIRSNDNRVAGSYFDEESATRTYNNACIQIQNAATRTDIVVDGCKGQVRGKFLGVSATSTLRDSSVINNHLKLLSKAAQFFIMNGSAFYNDISYNNINIDPTDGTLAAGHKIIDIPTATSNVGNNIIGNTVAGQSSAGTAGWYGIEGDFRNSIVMLNQIRRGTINQTNSNANTLNKDNILT